MSAFKFIREYWGVGLVGGYVACKTYNYQAQQQNVKHLQQHHAKREVAATERTRYYVVPGVDPKVYTFKRVQTCVMGRGISTLDQTESEVAVVQGIHGPDHEQLFTGGGSPFIWPWFLPSCPLPWNEPTFKANVITFQGEGIVEDYNLTVCNGKVMKEGKMLPSRAFEIDYSQRPF